MTEGVNIDVLTQAVLGQIAAQAPAANRNYSQEAIAAVSNTLKDQGYDENSINAARIYMGGTKQMVELTVKNEINKAVQENRIQSRDRDATNFVKGVLKEHYADAEYGAQLKKMDAAIRDAAYKKYFGDTQVNNRWNSGDFPEAEMEKALDETVDEFLKDVFGKDRKSNNTAIAPKPSSSEGAVTGDKKNVTPAQFANGLTGDFEKDLASLSDSQRQMYDATFSRLTQRLGKEPAAAQKTALETAKEMPAYFPVRGLTANI